MGQKFKRFSVHLDSVSNDNFNRFRVRTLPLSDAVALLKRDLIQFSASIRQLGSVSIIEPEAPGVLLRLARKTAPAEKKITDRTKFWVPPPKKSPIWPGLAPRHYDRRMRTLHHDVHRRPEALLLELAQGIRRERHHLGIYDSTGRGRPFFRQPININQPTLLPSTVCNISQIVVIVSLSSLSFVFARMRLEASFRKVRGCSAKEHTPKTVSEQVSE